MKIKTKSEPSISKNLAFSLSAIVFLVLAVMFICIDISYSYEMRKELEKKADEYIMRLTGILATSVWNLDLMHIEIIGTEFVLNELVEDVRVTDNYGQKLFSFVSRHSDQVKITRQRPIRYRGREIGRAEIALSLTRYQEDLNRLLKITGLMLAGAVVGLFFATGILLRVFLRKPLADLYQGMNRVARGDFSYREDHSHYKELSGIIRRFRKMAYKVQEREQALVSANQRLREEVAERKRAEAINRALFDISDAVNTTENLSDLYAFIHRALGRIMDVTNFYIALYDGKARTISFPYYADEADNEFPDISDFSETGSLSGEVILSRRPIILQKNDLLKRSEAQQLQGSLPEIWLGAPLLVKEEVVGVMAIQSYSDPERYDERDLELLASVSGQAAIAIQRKRAEQALKESDSKFKNLFDVSPQCIVLVELDTGILVDVNREFCRLTDLRREEALGRTMIELGLWEAEERRAFVGKLSRDGEVHGTETTFRLGQDRGVYAMMSAKIIEMEGRRMVLKVILDISAQRRALQEKEELQERLARSRKMEALGLLAGGVAHDLNNILSGVVSYPDLLLMNLPEGSDLRKPIETIRESGERAAAVVSDLLTLARGVASTRENLSLNRLIREYLRSPEFSELQSRYPFIGLHTRLCDDLLPISCSSVHLKKALMNLIVNAYEAIGEEGTVVISTLNRYVDRPVRGYDEVRIGEYALICVSDNGAGISDKDLERIFEPFYTRKVMGRSGTGLGLAVVWNTVQDHNGYIDVRSSLEGTEFDLYFPISRTPAQDMDQEVLFDEYAGNGETILVVDDEENQRMIACEMLEQLGYRAEAVSSGEAAVAYVRNRSADLILLDMVMSPGINGREAYKQITKIHPGQKAVIASGFADTEAVKETQALGAGRYLKKPYTLEALGLAVRAELDA